MSPCKALYRKTANPLSLCHMLAVADSALAVYPCKIARLVLLSGSFGLPLTVPVRF